METEAIKSCNENQTRPGIDNYHGNLRRKHYSKRVYLLVATTKDFVLQNGISLKTLDVRTQIKKLKSADLSDKSIIEGLITSFPGLKKTDIGILWIKHTYGNDLKGKKIDIEDEKKSLENA